MSFNIVHQSDNMEELTEVITASCFHPTHCNLLMYSSSRGCIKLGDMRQRALCDNHAKLFEINEEAADKSFFSEIIASISTLNLLGQMAGTLCLEITYSESTSSAGRRFNVFRSPRSLFPLTITNIFAAHIPSFYSVIVVDLC